MSQKLYPTTLYNHQIPNPTDHLWDVVGSLSRNSRVSSSFSNLCHGCKRGPTHYKYGVKWLASVYTCVHVKDTECAVILFIIFIIPVNQFSTNISPTTPDLCLNLMQASLSKFCSLCDLAASKKQIIMAMQINCTPYTGEVKRRKGQVR